MDLKLNKSALLACRPVMSDEEARWFLCGVNVREVSGVCVYYSTDAHVAVRITTEEPAPTGLNIIIPRYFVDNFADFVRGDVVSTYFPGEDGGLLNVPLHKGVSAVTNLVNGTYPDLNVTFTKTLEGHPSGGGLFNLALLDGLRGSLQELTGTGAARITFMEGDCPSYLVRDVPGFKWEGLIMPINGGYDAE